MAFDSHSRKPSSSSVGTRPFGFMARYAGSLFLPNAPPTSMRSCSSLSSPTAHIAFCTLDDVLRPQILIIAISLPDIFLANGAAKRDRRGGPGDDGWKRRAPLFEPARLFRQHDGYAVAD